MANQDLRIGIIGCGLMGGIHTDSYTATEGMRPAAYHNPTRAKAEALANQHGGTVCDSLDELLAADIDAVCIASPQAHHHQQVLAALDAGKHVFCEKPVALTQAECSDIQAKLTQTDLTFMTGHQMRVHPVITAVRQALPELGSVISLDLEWCFRIQGHQGRCWESYRLGGFFMELGCHAADLACFLMGKPVHVSGHTLRIDPKRVTEDFTHCLLQHESAAVTRILVTANHRTRRQGLLIGRVIGERGHINFTCYPYKRSFNRATLVIDHGEKTFVPDTTTRELPLPDLPSPTRDYPGFFDCYRRLAADFRDAVRSGHPPLCTFTDGRRAVEIVLATYDQQGQASASPNLIQSHSAYQSDSACHPLLGHVISSK